MSKKLVYQEGMDIIQYLKENVNLKNLDLNQILEVKYNPSYKRRWENSGINTGELINFQMVKMKLETYLSIYENGGTVECSYICEYCEEIYTKKTCGLIYALKRNPKLSCKKCSGKKIADTKHKNGNSIGDVYPELIKYWSDKNKKSIYLYAHATKQNLWWKCEKGCPDYQMRPIDKLKCGCPYCSNKRVWEGNCLANTYPDVAKDWDMYKNKDLKPTDVVYGSTKKVWFKCHKCGYEWKSLIVDRTVGEHGCDKCFRESISGEKHYRWRHDLTEEDRENIRNSTENEYFRKDVYERDNYTCQICGDNTGGNLNAHHLNSWNWAKEERLDLDNAITLCEDCHKSFHSKYGYGNNTKEQFDEFLEELKTTHESVS